MRAVVQRVKKAEVRVGAPRGGGRKRNARAAGGRKNNTPEDARSLADKILNLRIFDDSAGRMNLSLLETNGELLCVPSSRFTAIAVRVAGRATTRRPGRKRRAGCTTFRGRGAGRRRHRPDGTVPGHDGRGACERRAGDAAARLGADLSRSNTPRSTEVQRMEKKVKF